MVRVLWRMVSGPLQAMLFFCLAVFCVSPAEEQGPSVEEFQRFSALPFASYSEETKIQYGGIFILFLKPFEGGSKVSSIDFVAMGTQNRQYTFRTKPELYLVKDHIHIPSKFEVSNWCGKLFERGSKGSNEAIADYDQVSFYGKVPVEMDFGLRGFLPLSYGIVATAEKRDNSFEKGFDKDSYNGGALQDGTFGGAGYRLVSDVRDNKNWPVLGYYASFEQILYSGDFHFHSEELDLRGYAPLFWTTSVATGVLWKQVKGDVPFGYLAGPNGTQRFRGVDPGVWNDTQVLIAQLEFRKTLFWRLAGTIFGEWMQSGPHFGALFRNDYHYSMGFGGRLALNKSEKLYARGDISFVDGKTIGLTIDLREAF